MERESRQQLNQRIENNRIRARQQGVESSSGIWVNTSRGRRYYKDGVGQPRARERSPQQGR